MQASKGFLNTLQLMDDKLHVRWGDCVGKWVIERDGYISDTERGYLRSRQSRLARLLVQQVQGCSEWHKIRNEWMGVSEELASAQRGRRVVLIVQQLDSNVFNKLALADIQRYGGYSRMADELERQEAAAQADADRQLTNELIAVNKESVDILRFLWRKKETQMLAGERDLSKLLHGKPGRNVLTQ